MTRDAFAVCERFDRMRLWVEQLELFAASGVGGSQCVSGVGAKLGRVGLLDRLFRRGDAAEARERPRTPESEHSGEGDQRTLESTSAEEVIDASRVPGEAEEPDRPPRSQ